MSATRNIQEGLSPMLSMTLKRAGDLTEQAGRTLELVSKLVADYRSAPKEVLAVIEQARAIFDASPISIWCKYEDGTNVYSNPHYKRTIVDYEGVRDLSQWGKTTGTQFRDNDAKAADEGSALVHEEGWNPSAQRYEHWWISKWRQQVATESGLKTLVWGVLLATVVGSGKRPD